MSDRFYGLFIHIFSVYDANARTLRFSFIPISLDIVEPASSRRRIRIIRAPYLAIAWFSGKYGKERNAFNVSILLNI